MVWTFLRTLLLALASFGYLANGAQAHLHVSGSESMDLMMCSTGSARTISIEIPGEPIQETEDNCCGDCVPSVTTGPPDAPSFKSVLIFADPVPSNLPLAVSPRAPLWPGAPPQGPPYTLKA